MHIHRDDFRQVRPTSSEVADFMKRHPYNRPNDYPARAEHLPCGKRIWYVGIAIGSHMRACPGTR